MKNIAIIGMPGAGKTTVGKLLAEKLCMDFFDLDEYIKAETKKDINELFLQGEDSFRQTECIALKELIKKENIILALGGGTILKNENIELIKEFFIIFINRPIEEIIKDIDISTRPLLQRLEQLQDIYDERIENYENSCDLEVYNASTPKVCVERILGGLYEEDIDN